MSELVRRAVDRLLEQMPASASSRPAMFPTFRGGGLLVDAGALREVLHGRDDDPTSDAAHDSPPARRP